MNHDWHNEKERDVLFTRLSDIIDKVDKNPLLFKEYGLLDEYRSLCEQLLRTQKLPALMGNTLTRVHGFCENFTRKELQTHVGK